MKIYISDITEEGREFTGILSAELLNTEDEIYRCTEPIEYSLFLLVSGNLITATGSLQVKVQGQCGRCSDYFPLNIKIKNFAASQDVMGDSVDFSTEIREEVLINLPLLPKCVLTGKGLCPYSHPFELVQQSDELENMEPTGDDQISPKDVWNTLDKLDFQEKEEERKQR